MSYAVLEKELATLPEQYVNDIVEYIHFIKYKISDQILTQTSSKKSPVILGLAEGQYHIPDDINAYDDEIADMFEEYL